MGYLPGISRLLGSEYLIRNLEGIYLYPVLNREWVLGEYAVWPYSNSMACPRDGDDRLADPWTRREKQ